MYVIHRCAQMINGLNLTEKYRDFLTKTLLFTAVSAHSATRQFDTAKTTATTSAANYLPYLEIHIQPPHVPALLCCFTFSLQDTKETCRKITLQRKVQPIAPAAVSSRGAAVADANLEKGKLPSGYHYRVRCLDSPYRMGKCPRIITV